jgi:putative copper export protein
MTKRRRAAAALLAVLAALALASPAFAGHGRSGSTIIALD